MNGSSEKDLAVFVCAVCGWGIINWAIFFYNKAQFTRIHPTEFPEFMLVWDRKSNLSDQHFNVIPVRVREIHRDETEIKGNWKFMSLYCVMNEAFPV